MNQMTKRCTFFYDSFHDVYKKENYLIAAVAGIVLGVMLGLGV